MTMYRPHRLCPKENKPKEPSLYRSLCISILSMFLSTVMLVGTTMAWFSDSLQTGVYTITSATFSTTVYYCTDLSNAVNTPNNWQRLNPGNTTLFGGGSLSSEDGQVGQDGQRSQVAYLKLVNNSNIPLQYKFTLLPSEAGSSIDNLSLTGCQYKKGSDSSDVALTEADLSAATPDPDSNSPKEVVFTVPAATNDNNSAIVYAVLKLTYTAPSGGETSTSSNIYKFALKVAVTQTGDGAGETASNSLPTPNTEVTIETGGTALASAHNSTNDDGDDQSDEGTTTANTETPASPETPTNPPTGTGDTTVTPESGTAGTGDSSEAPAAESEPAPDPTT